LQFLLKRRGGKQNGNSGLRMSRKTVTSGEGGASGKLENVEAKLKGGVCGRVERAKSDEGVGRGTSDYRSG